MAYYDLREFLAQLDQRGELARVKVEVDPEYEVGAIMRRVFDQRGKAVLFENVKGHKVPLVSGVLDTENRYAMAIDAKAEMRAIFEKALRAAQNPVPPILVDSAPCQEVALGPDELDIRTLPAPRWHHLDPGRFVGTLGVVFLKDPETGIRNMGIYRQQIHGRNEVGFLGYQQAGVIVQKYFAQKKPVPVATAFGVDPAILAASSFHAPFGVDEIGIAGALRGAPVPLTKAKTVDLEVPATAEIVVEGEIPPDRASWKEEGPFGEFTGYYGGLAAVRPLIQIKTITHRKDPIYQATLEGLPPSESTTMRTVGHTVGAWMKLLAAGVPGVKELYITPMSCAVFTAIVSIDRHFYKGQVRQIMNALWTTRTPKWVIVVDDDIDIFQPGQVEWAISTRVQPHRDIFVSTDEYAGVTLDPSIEPGKRDYPACQTSVIGIDATKGFKGFDFSPEIRTRPEDLARIEKRWKEYGIS